MPSFIEDERTAETSSASVERMELSMPSWLRDEINELAESRALTRSAYIRIVLMDHVNAQKRQANRP
jgi:metal-responsive CopG/Arc/MetJ family transcriptional regulator